MPFRLYVDSDNGVDVLPNYDFKDVTIRLNLFIIPHPQAEVNIS